MKQKVSSPKAGALFVGLAVIALVTIAGILTLGSPFVEGASLVHSSGTTTAGEQSLVTPGAPAFQTESFRITQKMIMIATDNATTHTPWPTQPIPPTGIYENERTKPSGEKLGLDAQNGWFGLIDGNQVTIYAGALLENPNQGAIYILMSFPGCSLYERILTPDKHGTVRVVSEHNNRLTLVAADGVLFYFDVPARRFVASLSEVVPTATPPPTYTPYAPTPGIAVSTSNPYP